MVELYKTKNSDVANGLVKQWCEKQKDIENLQAEQKAIENEMCEKFAEFKVGEVIREVISGKRHVVFNIEVNKWALKGLHNQGGNIMLEYTTRPIKKDGSVSLNNSIIHGTVEVKSTGEHIELTRKD